MSPVHEGLVSMSGCNAAPFLKIISTAREKEKKILAGNNHLMYVLSIMMAQKEKSSEWSVTKQT